MILKSIRLHPFGGTLDRTYDLARTVAVLLGPNEAGKSTLRQALHHALFTPTKQTKTQAEATVGRWYPRPTGDHAAVTLVFEHDGRAWTLTKRWGAGAASSLSAAGAAAIGEAAAVQEAVATFLGHNEATGRLVLYTGQAELARTIGALEEAGKDDALRSV
ncbi:MAG: AAA family ATPase, partial [Planctomycetia bacterium]